jgi:hypothetical protein
VRVSKLFLWGQSENISISVKDDIRFGGVFPLSVITSKCNRIKISKVCFGKGFRCHSFSFLFFYFFILFYFFY